MGVEVASCITGDGRVERNRAIPPGGLNVVQCSGSMTHLAQLMQRKVPDPLQKGLLLRHRRHRRRALQRGAPLQ
jgi:nitrogenase molybdenum-cofactor synthesis protein NifE